MHRSFIIPLVLALWWPGPAGVQAAAGPPSRSKISVHLLSSYSAGARQIIDARPPVLKILDTSLMGAARDYKASTPNGKTVLRIYTPRSWSRSENPSAAASNFWSTVLAPPLNGLSAADRALIDYVEGPNEGDSTPTWASAADTIWYNDFWLTLARLIADAGFKPCAYSISVGNPPGSTAEIQATLDRIAPSLRYIQSRGGAWSYHNYTIQYTTNVAVENFYSLRHRIYYNYFATAHPDLVDLPILMTEGGVDGAGAWSERGSAEMFQNWLVWLDEQLRPESRVLGVTLFQIGDNGGWGRFNVESLADWIATRLNSLPGTASAAALVVNPSALVVNAPQGTVPTNRSFTIRNAGAGVMNYTLTDDAAWLHKSVAAGSSTGELDTITLSFDASVAALAASTYVATVSASSPEATNSPKTFTLTLTLTPSNAPVEWDARLTSLGVYVVETNVPAGTYYWRLVSGSYEDDTQSGGNHNIYYRALGTNGAPIANQRCWAAYPSSAPANFVELFTKDAVDGYWGNYAMSGGNWCPFYPMGPRGPYVAYLDGPSDSVWGMGMPCNLHVNYRYVWQRTLKGGTTTNTGGVTQPFETLPAWNSSFDAAWGNAAAFTLVAGGQTGNALQAVRTGSGSSARVQVFPVVPNTAYELSVWIRCSNAAAAWWGETAFKLGSATAQDFDSNVGSWTMVKKFSDSGANGNGGVWTRYTTNFNSGSSSQVSVGFKLGANPGSGPSMQWDQLNLLPLTLPTLTLAVAESPTNVSAFFAQPVTAAAAVNPANVTLRTSGGTLVPITSARLTNGTNLLLTTTAQATRVDHTLTISNVPAVSQGALSGRNGAVTVRVPLTVIPLDAATAWRYQQSGGDPGPAWRTTGYNDAAWPTGAPLLAYESAPLPEPIRTTLTTNNGRYTFYFRHRFDLPGAVGGAVLRLRAIIDDGAVFWLNGAELFRLGLTDDPVLFTTPASRTVGEAVYEGPFLLSATLAPTNVLAAEVHQATASSSDIVFGLSLEALALPSQWPGSSPMLSIGRQSNSVLLSWNAPAYTLESAPTVVGPWTAQPGAASPFTVFLTNAARFFRLAD